jgi:hypothetical protein
MRKLVLLLGVSAIGLAIACGYLYQQLQHERSRNESSTADVRSTRATDDATASANDGSLLTNESFDDPESPSPTRERSQDPPPDPAAGVRPDRRAERRAQLQQRWSDPAFRSRALVRTKYQLRQRNPDVGSALRLNASQESAFVDLLARQELQIEEANEPMRFASEAERGAIQQQINSLTLQHEQERAEQLGQARYQEYREYQRQIPERQQIRELRSRHDEASPLTASQSSRLIDAMYQERDSYLQQMKTVENFGGYMAQYPFTAMTRDRDPVARVRFAEEQVARTEEFMGRLRLRASEVLSAAQLRRFDEIQEEQLTMVQSQVERIRNQANRRSARGPRAPQERRP